MATAAVEFQRAQSLLNTDRNASIDILHSIGKLLLSSLKEITLCSDFRYTLFGHRLAVFRGAGSLAADSPSHG